VGTGPLANLGDSSRATPTSLNGRKREDKSTTGSWYYDDVGGLSPWLRSVLCSGDCIRRVDPGRLRDWGSDPHFLFAAIGRVRNTAGLCGRTNRISSRFGVLRSNIRSVQGSTGILNTTFRLRCYRGSFLGLVHQKQMAYTIPGTGGFGPKRGHFGRGVGGTMVPASGSEAKKNGRLPVRDRGAGQSSNTVTCLGCKPAMGRLALLPFIHVLPGSG